MKWQAAAAKAGLTLTAWLTKAVDAYAATLGLPMGTPPKPRNPDRQV